MTSPPGLTVITGAGGFLGNAVVQHALRSGYPIRATSRSAGSRPDGVESRPADLRDLGALERAFDGATTVIHAAGLAHVFGRSAKNPEAFHAANVLGTLHAMTAAIRSSVRHLVLISSVSVYGGASREPRGELSSCTPEGAYARSKLESERIAIEAAVRGSIRLTILRMATIYGSGDPGNVARLFRTIDRSRFIWIGSGSNRKSLIHKKDAARACFAAARSPGPPVEVFNVSHLPVTMRDVVHTIGRALGRTVPDLRISTKGVLCVLNVVDSLIRRAPFIDRIRATLSKWTSNDSYSANKLQDKLGFIPLISLSEGIEEEADWYRQTTNTSLPSSRQAVEG